MNQAGDVVGQYLEQDFVDLRDGRFAPNEVPEDALDRGKAGLHIAPLVIVLHELTAPEIVEMEQAIPCGSLHVRLGLRVIAERNERRNAHVVYEGDHLPAAVSFVGGNFGHRKILSGFFEQWFKLRDIVPVPVGDGDRRHDVGLYADHRMELHIVAHILLVAVFGREMPVEPLHAKAGGVRREIGFDRPERKAACGYQALDDRRDLFGLDHVEDTVVARRMNDIPLSLRFA